MFRIHSPPQAKEDTYCTILFWVLTCGVTLPIWPNRQCRPVLKCKPCYKRRSSAKVQLRFAFILAESENLCLHQRVRIGRFSEWQRDLFTKVVTVDAEGVEQLIEKSFRSGVPPLLSPSLTSFFSSAPFNLMRFVRSVTSSALKDYIAALPDFISANFRNTKEMKLDRMSMLVDSTYVAPLALGLPLKLNACASAALKLTLAGFVNTTSFTSHGHLDVDGKLRPSIALSGVGSMWVDAHHARTEARLQGRFLSSSALEGSLSVKGNKFVRLSFDLPMHKADLISAETRLVTVRGTHEHEHSGSADVDQLIEECSWPLLDEMLALRVCSQVRVPAPNQLIAAPLLLLRQPLRFALSLDKSDPSAKRYTFLYTVVERPAENRTVMSAVFETPGSLINRTVRAEVAYSQHIYNISLLVQSQNNRLSAQGRYVRLPLDRSLVFGLDINGKKHVDIEVSFRSTEGKYGYTHQPKLDFQINGKSVAHLDGTLKWVEKKGIAPVRCGSHFRTQRFEATAHGYIRGCSAVELESTAYPHINLILNIKLLVMRAQEHVEYIADLQTNPPPAVVVGDVASPLHSATGGVASPLHSTTGGAASPLHSTTGGVASPLHSTAGGVASPLHTAAGGVASPLHSTAGGVPSPLHSASSGGVAADMRRLSAQASFASFRTFVGHKTSTFVELRKPDAGIDLKLGYAHEQRLHTDSNHVIVVRYAQGRLFDRRSGQLKFRAELPVNCEVVALSASDVTLDLLILEMSGAWFSGHNVSVRGHYSDRSSPAVTSHTLKLLLAAPLLLDADWSLAARLHATDQQRKLDLQAAQGVSYSGLSQSGTTPSAAVYELRLENQYEPQVSLDIGGEVRLNSSLYTLWSHVDLAERRLSLDMHLDRSRDVRVDAWAWRNLSSMLIGGAVRWDANRDPTQFVAVDLKSVAATSSGNQSNHYDAQLMLEYPGRRLDGVLRVRSVGFLAQKFRVGAGVNFLIPTTYVRTANR
ncbi:hypothetical protein LSTR_LSTR013703 [Laodelphax striatellus]|uniref:Vitellinogen open beta-sheet domain-containing protein n=1 Tax=Laodelphax striatellus TaxID=195883 RepID=A0A482WLV6_LAOST|nr:hypothetical protein LSTR_LSTR013703 [Laodelphax striatellus]